MLYSKIGEGEMGNLKTAPLGEGITIFSGARNFTPYRHSWRGRPTRIKPLEADFCRVVANAHRARGREGGQRERERP
eukprot:361791-Chlamydomonas_euryale.AAC.12